MKLKNVFWLIYILCMCVTLGLIVAQEPNLKMWNVDKNFLQDFAAMIFLILGPYVFVAIIFVFSEKKSKFGITANLFPLVAGTGVFLYCFFFDRKMFTELLFFMPCYQIVYIATIGSFLHILSEDVDPPPNNK